MTRAAREARELAAAICEALTVPHPARPQGWARSDKVLAIRAAAEYVPAYAVGQEDA